MEKRKRITSALQKMTKRRFIAVYNAVNRFVKTIYNCVYKEYYIIIIIFFYISITFLNIFCTFMYIVIIYI